jgi:THO complex subunit 1 transcription elongation factor
MVAMAQPSFDSHVEAVRAAVEEKLAAEEASPKTMARVAAEAASLTGVVLSKELQKTAMQEALEAVVLDVLAGGKAGERVALFLVNVATMLNEVEAVSLEFPPELLQIVLLTGDAGRIGRECRQQLVGCFAVMREVGLVQGKLIGRMELTKAVVLFLRRDVVRTDPVLSGLVRKELMSTLPAWEISGINMMGRFDVDNVTVLEKDGSGGDTDWAVYRTLWGLQQHFANAALCETESGWADFVRGVGIILKTLERTETAADDHGAEAEAGMEHGSVKYLTCPELLGLQLADMHLRRNFLVQIAVLLHMFQVKWLSKGEAATKSAGVAQGEAAWRAKAFQGDGNGTGDALLVEAKRLLFKMDTRSDCSGGGFEQKLTPFFEETLRREKRWIEWKDTRPRAENPGAGLKRAHKMISSSAKDEDLLKDVRRLLDRGKVSRSGESQSVIPELNLFRVDGNYSSVSARPISTCDEGGREESWAEIGKEERRKLLRVDSKSTPSVVAKQYENELRQDMEDEAEMDEEYWKRNNAAYVWRSVRRLGEHALERFLAVGDGEENASAFPVFDIRRAFEVLPSEDATGPEKSDSPDDADRMAAEKGTESQEKMPGSEQGKVASRVEDPMPPSCTTGEMPAPRPADPVKKPADAVEMPADALEMPAGAVETSVDAREEPVEVDFDVNAEKTGDGPAEEIQ